MNLKPNMNQLIALDSGPLEWQKTHDIMSGTACKTCMEIDTQSYTVRMQKMNSHFCLTRSFWLQN